MCFSFGPKPSILSESHRKYKEAVALDPSSNGANFGIGLTSLMGLFKDDLLFTTLSEWSNCIGDIEDDLGYDLDRSSKSIIDYNQFYFGIPRSERAFFAFDFTEIINIIPVLTPQNNIFSSSKKLR